MKHWIRFPVFIGFLFSVAALCGVLWAGLSHRLLGAHFKTALTHFRLASLAAFLAIFLLVVCALWATWIKQRSYLSICFIGLVIAIPIAVGALRMKRAAAAVPMIHDISTDTEHPPEFVRILALRKDAPNSAVYEGKEIAEKQKASYPYIVTINLGKSKTEVFERSLRIVRELGWDLVEAEKETGRIEATETSFLFGFKDDVVIRLVALEGATRVDVRSVSREGKSDLGVNARRIRSFLERLMAP